MLSERRQTQKATFFCNSIYMKCAEQANPEIKDQWLPGAEVKKQWGETAKGYGLLGG